MAAHVNTHRCGGGRPQVADRKCADGILYVMRTGCQWKALHRTNLCSGSTAHDRFQEWVAGDAFLKLSKQGVEQFDEMRVVQEGGKPSSPASARRVYSHASEKP